MFAFLVEIKVKMKFIRNRMHGWFKQTLSTWRTIANGMIYFHSVQFKQQGWSSGLVSLADKSNNPYLWTLGKFGNANMLLFNASVRYYLSFAVYKTLFPFFEVYWNVHSLHKIHTKLTTCRRIFHVVENWKFILFTVLNFRLFYCAEN